MLEDEIVLKIRNYALKNSEKNDIHGFDLPGKPRYLNRHKSYLPDMDLADPVDPFQRVYLSLMNRILELRSLDNAFYPGSDDFEFLALTDTLFLNHPYHDGDHSLILGNISEKAVTYKLILPELDGIDKNWLDLKKGKPLTDGITKAKFIMDDQGSVNLELPPYGMFWLK